MNDVELAMATYNVDPKKDNYMLEYLKTNFNFRAGWMKSLGDRILFMEGDLTYPGVDEHNLKSPLPKFALKEKYKSYEDMDEGYKKHIKILFNSIKEQKIENE